MVDYNVCIGLVTKPYAISIVPSHLFDMDVYCGQWSRGSNDSSHFDLPSRVNRNVMRITENALS